MEAAERALTRAIVTLSRQSMGPSLFVGFTGVAWVNELLTGDPSATRQDDANAPIDEALETYLDRSPWTDPYDLVEGLVGIGVYGLERMPRPSAKRLLALVVRRLGETARRRAPGLVWWSDPEWVPRKLRKKSPADYDLGVAHGVPGVIAVLGKIVASDLDARTRTRARALLDGAVEWLLAQELPRSSPSCFAMFAGETTPARSAWCYGDPGIAATLLVAARAVGERAWERNAVRIAMRAAARAESDSGVRDAGLCHGSAGLAHVYHRLYRWTDEERFARASRAWFARTLAERRSRGGFAGFAARALDRSGKVTWQADPGFVTGAVGVTLALVAATTSMDPVWDRALLLS